MSELDLGQEKVQLTAHIKKWQADRMLLLSEKKGIETQLADIEENLKFALKIAGVEQSPVMGMFGEDEPEKQETMVETATKILKEADGWITHKKIKQGLRKIPHLKAMMKASPNYYYTMIRRMVEREDVEKDGKKYRYIGMLK